MTTSNFFIKMSNLFINVQTRLTILSCGGSSLAKSAGTIEQKGVAQLLQIEEVQLNHKRCGFNYAQLGTPKLAIFMNFGEFITYFVRLCLFHQEYIILEYSWFHANVFLLVRQFQKAYCFRS